MIRLEIGIETKGISKDPLRLLKRIVKTPEDLIKNKHLIKLLSEGEKEDLSLWTFQNIAQT